MGEVSRISRLAFDGLVSHLGTELDHLVPVFDRRMSCEPWLHVEFGYVLRQMIDRGKITSMELEKPYPRPRGARCDIWFSGDDTEAWIEMKSVVTNYGGAGKPITNQVDSVIGDMQKLANAPADAERLVLFVVYPLASSGTDESSWSHHMNKLEETLRIGVEPANLEVTPNKSLRLYLGSSRSDPATTLG